MGLKVSFGDFAENLTTEGLNLVELPISQRLRIGKDVEVEVSQIGKECLRPCAIYYSVGDCIMPREGIFVQVLKSGRVKVGDEIEVVR
jgi:MOSC domain-containing protein YiiM